MRILASAYHPSGFWPYSGSERRFCALTVAWARSGTETWALEPDPIAAETLTAGYRALRISVRGSGLPGALLSWTLRAVSRGLAAASETRFDLVYATNNNLFNLLAASVLAKRLALPCAVVVHHLRWVEYRQPARAESEGRYDPLAFLEALGREGAPFGSSVTRAAGAELESRLLGRFDGFLTVSDAVRRQLTAWMPDHPAYTTGNGLDPRRTPPATDTARGPTALYVGRIDEGKGTLDLVQAWERVGRRSPEARLEIIGDGSLRQRLERAVARAGLESRVQLRGFLRDAALEEARRSSRAFVTLSRTEGFGIAVAEALGSGLPVVAWDIPPFREIWGGCPAVALCPPGDLDAVAESVVGFLDAPPARWADLSREASSYVRRYAWGDVAVREADALRAITGGA